MPALLAAERPDLPARWAAEWPGTGASSYCEYAQIGRPGTRPLCRICSLLSAGIPTHVTCQNHPTRSATTHLPTNQQCPPVQRHAPLRPDTQTLARVYRMAGFHADTSAGMGWPHRANAATRLSAASGYAGGRFVRTRSMRNPAHPLAARQMPRNGEASKCPNTQQRAKKQIHARHPTL